MSRKQKRDGKALDPTQAPSRAFSEQPTVRMAGIEVPTSPSQGRLAALDESWLQKELQEDFDTPSKRELPKPHVPYPTPPPQRWETKPTSLPSAPPVSRSLYPTPAHASLPLEKKGPSEPQQTTGTLAGLPAQDPQRTENMSGLVDPLDQQDTENLPGISQESHQQSTANAFQTNEIDELELTLSSEANPLYAPVSTTTKKRDERTAIFTDLQASLAIQEVIPPTFLSKEEALSHTLSQNILQATPHNPSSPPPTTRPSPRSSPYSTNPPPQKSRSFENYMLFGGIGILFTLLLVWSLFIFVSLRAPTKTAPTKTTTSKHQSKKK